MRRYPLAWAVGAFAIWGAVRLVSQAGPLTINSDRELFVDRHLLDRLHNAELRLALPVDRGPVLQLDRPWEGAFSNYFTVIHDGPTYRLYYRGEPNDGPDGGSGEVTAYAESQDGIHWTRPDLGLFVAQGTPRNNIILAGMPPFSHNFSPFLDENPGAVRDQRYKALAGTSASGLVPFVSGDGIHWRKLQERAVITTPGEFAFDSQNVSFWSQSEQRYICYFRTWKTIAGTKYRWVSRVTSADYVHWTDRLEMNYGEAPAEHLYTNQTSPYFRAPQIYLGVCARFEPGRQVLSAEQAKAIKVDPNYFKDCSDAVLISTRGGNRYDRTFMNAILRPGVGWENWVSRSNYPALNLVQTGPSELSFYVARNYGQPSAYLRRYSLRLDGFSSLHADYSGGDAVTYPVRFRGRHLEINYSTSAAGSVRVELQDANGTLLPGYGSKDCREIIGDEIEHTVEWNLDKDVSALQNQPVRLKFILKDADVYSFRLVP